jgi:hypothetical protein
MNSFLTWHIFLQVGKTQDLPSKIWQTLRDVLSYMNETDFVSFAHFCQSVG